MSEDQRTLGNRLAGEAVKLIVGDIVNAGGSNIDVMICLESVVVGVALACIRLGGDEPVLDVMLQGARDRLAEIRLKDLSAAGQA